MTKSGDPDLPFTALEEWRQAWLQERLKEGFKPHEFLGLLEKAQNLPGPPPSRLAVWRWRHALVAVFIALLGAVACIGIGIAGPAKSTWPSIVAGIGGGVVGSSIVALVVLIMEVMRSEIMGVEASKALKHQLAALDDYHFERFNETMARIAAVDETIGPDLWDGLDRRFDELERLVRGLRDDAWRNEPW